MLELAIIYEEKLRNRLNQTWFDEKYMYYELGGYHSEFVIDKDTWNRHQFVSIDCRGIVIGYIDYNIDRQTYSACHLTAINFTDDIMTFGADLRKAVIDIFEKFKFNKLSFSVVIGNPIEKSYDKMIEKYHGRIVGIKKDEARLMDGNLYDVKMYEILRKDYSSSQCLR